MNPLRRTLAFVLLLALAPVAVLRAQTVTGAPNTIDYQGKALDSTGALLSATSATNFTMYFRIYDAQEGGNIVWSESQVVTVSKGLFSVRIGEGVAIGTEPHGALKDAFSTSARFLGVTIVISGQTPAEILPRLAFLAAPYAFVANKAITAQYLVLDSATSAAPSSVNLSQVSHSYASVNASTTLTDQAHTWSVAGGTTSTTITLPGVTTRREYYIFKYDNTDAPVIIQSQSGGTINGQTTIKLKAMGEGVVLENTDGNNWWIVGDTRDRTPVGTIITLARGGSYSVPGYRYCDGTSLSRTDVRYVDLFNTISTAWGAPDASTFRVPDLRGMFLRGVDGGRGADDDRNSRTAPYPGGNTGDAVGSYEATAVQSHTHTGSVSGATDTQGNHYHVVGGEASGGWNAGTAQTSDRGRNTTFNTDYAGNHSHNFSASFTTGSTGSAETRPENMAVYYFIKL